jgi:hypothetical protein
MQERRRTPLIFEPDFQSFQSITISNNFKVRLVMSSFISKTIGRLVPTGKNADPGRRNNKLLEKVLARIISNS